MVNPTPLDAPIKNNSIRKPILIVFEIFLFISHIGILGISVFNTIEIGFIPSEIFEEVIFSLLAIISIAYVSSWHIFSKQYAQKQTINSKAFPWIVLLRFLSFLVSCFLFFLVILFLSFQDFQMKQENFLSNIIILFFGILAISQLTYTLLTPIPSQKATKS